MSSESKPETTVFAPNKSVLHPLISGLAFSCLLACADDAVVADDVGSDPVKKHEASWELKLAGHVQFLIR